MLGRFGLFGATSCVLDVLTVARFSGLLMPGRWGQLIVRRRSEPLLGLELELELALELEVPFDGPAGTSSSSSISLGVAE